MSGPSPAKVDSSHARHTGEHSPITELAVAPPSMQEPQVASCLSSQPQGLLFHGIDIASATVEVLVVLGAVPEAPPAPADVSEGLDDDVVGADEAWRVDRAV